MMHYISCCRLTIYTLADSCPNLKTLKLNYCDEISYMGIRKIAQFYFWNSSMFRV
ncbi:hypothetical protein GLOIN_2v1619431 [Rhizophagus irregularis DAOM 181602=DAOM 197198]|uniref:Uncharacterized protein n=1 Tax=Rhizophagus irregularis (strain DAOM 181602 / DAOM 197198 / MUCL 43194) TaxID=747089 RepID=A0A2P4PXJ1_RHIID|nr:hypothetical protein GLOIN_2v1619431 [Rhizophagus irregularis DAOM 181602=DAOM 197198]POG70102.1 hypothetical protein GLOIN_2v1619431 [Rhizophagus irregularis DAOM 181602=DAOM 197198]|eukprot:XP_025176968.1 hypothetical protein GLOIN_2v1619431 [Rhizophagus irregularis DAOM 181602=DAOM 197198]